MARGLSQMHGKYNYTSVRLTNTVDRAKKVMSVTMSRLRGLMLLFCAMYAFRPAAAQHGPTCRALTNMISRITSMDCTRDSQCSQLNCVTTEAGFQGTRITMTLLRCRQPPSVRVRAVDRSGSVILNRIFHQSVSGINIGSGKTLDVTVRQLRGSIGVSAVVRVRFGFFVFRRTLIPYSVIPLRTQDCRAATSPTTRPTTQRPTARPTTRPTTQRPTARPTTRPTTQRPTARPTTRPTTQRPTARPTTRPTTQRPTARPTTRPTTQRPTARPTTRPTTQRPTARPTTRPTTQRPTARPTTRPTTQRPTARPTTRPTTQRPTARPTTRPTTQRPTARPTTRPTTQQPTTRPTARPTTQQPTTRPTTRPTTQQPMTRPTTRPTARPTTQQPTTRLTTGPTTRPTTQTTTVFIFGTITESTLSIAAGSDMDGSPTTQETTESPTTQETTESPTTQETIESPTTQETTESPTTQETTESPTTQETTESPTTQETTESPTTQETTQSPTVTTEETTGTLVTQSTQVPTTEEGTTTREITETPTMNENTITHKTPMTQQPPETEEAPVTESTTIGSHNPDAPESTDIPELILNTEISTTPDTSETPTVERVSPSTQLPQSQTSCTALDEVAKSSQTFDCVASTEEPCDHIDCATDWGGSMFTAEVVLLPCYTPYAVQISMSREKEVLLNKTVGHSQEIDIPDLYSLTLIVTLDHFQDAIGLQMDYSLPLQGGEKPVLPYAVVPMNSSHCEEFVSLLSVQLDNPGGVTKGGVPEVRAALVTLIPLLWFAVGMI